MDVDAPPSSPTHPTGRHKLPGIPGFRPSQRPKQTPIAEMSIRELQDRHNLNARLLASPGASTSTYIQRVLTEQAAVESRLLELDGMETINNRLRRATIKGEGDMDIDTPPEPPTSRTLEAKRKALARFGAQTNTSRSGGSGLSLQEAMELERQAFQQEKEREERIAEKKRRMGMPVKGEVLTRQEREARIWAFMNHKPTESDLEDDTDEEDDDPANWFDDDQDDGRKGQNIVDPDGEDLSDIIRIDGSRAGFSNYYEPQYDGD